MISPNELFDGNLVRGRDSLKYSVGSQNTVSSHYFLRLALMLIKVMLKTGELATVHMVLIMSVHVLMLAS